MCSLTVRCFITSGVLCCLWDWKWLQNDDELTIYCIYVNEKMASSENVVVLNGKQVVIVAGNTHVQPHRIPVLRVLGGIHCAIGLTCVISNSISLSNHMSTLGVTGLDAGSLTLSFWFILTGIFPLFMSESRRSVWKGLKIAFMVFSILGAALFVPAIIIMELIILIAISLSRDSDPQVALQVVIMSFSTLEFIIAVISASVCCCCSSLDDYRIKRSETEAPPVQESQVNNDHIIRDDPTDQITALSYEEPINHSDVYDEIEDRYYESLGEKESREQYDQLKQTNGHETDKYLSLGPQSPNNSYDQLQNDLQIKTHGRNKYLSLASHSMSNYSNNESQKPNHEAHRELPDKTNYHNDWNSSHDRPLSQTIPKEPFTVEQQNKNKYDKFGRHSKTEQKQHQDKNTVTQRYSYLDASSGVKNGDS